ncbi:3-hydroxyacyl-CoA dehydrogenase NAD-binding domain-containing protein [Chloroflexota bacterium]
MKYKVNKVVVIGAGVMGGGIAALFANAGVRVTLLDIVPNKLTHKEDSAGLTLADPEVRNRIVGEGLDRTIKSRPASFFKKDFADLVTIGNLEDDFELISDADWLIEVIIENLDIKRQLMERIDNIRAPSSIVSTNTSGIPVSSISSGFSKGLREHFLGTHFFNPPRYLKLLEIIPTADTLPEVVDFICQFSDQRLGKGIVLAKDTPNFIANRIFAGSAAYAMDYILEHGYTVTEVDAITGPPIGNPRTATFRLFDLIGIDVWQHVGKNLAPEIPHDEHALRYIKSEKVNHLIDSMVADGRYGVKTKEGFYKQVRTPEGKKTFWPLNLQTLEYEEVTRVRFESIGKVKDEPDLGIRLKTLLAADDKAGQLVRALTYQSLAYASERIPEIADTPRPIDDAMRWGFGREAGPFETWDLLGVAETNLAMEKAGFPPAPWVETMLDSGFETFYQYQNEVKVAVYNPSTGKYAAVIRPDSYVHLQEKKAAGQVLKKNLGASCIDLGDGVACIEFHTKMNTLDIDIFDMIEAGLNIVEDDYEGLVIGNEADNFSAGANLFLVVMAAQSGEWDQLEGVIKKMQDLLMRVRYFSKPVVIAPAGLALGGGAEVIVSGSKVVAAAELYTGFVEVGAGVIPAGGGTKEMLRRILNPPMRVPDTIGLPFLQKIFEQIGLGKVATSAEEARDFNILSPCDRVVMIRDTLLTEAKKEVLHMASSVYVPPKPEKIYASGRDAYNALRVAVHMMREGEYITEHELLIARKLAYVMAGGELSKPAWVDEQYILDLEREAFMSLAGEGKSQERMWSLLNTGKVLRN